MNFKAWLAVGGFAFAGVVSAVGCSGSSCDDLTTELSQCPQYKAPSTTSTSTSTGGDTNNCTDIEAKCSQCYLDNIGDICTTLYEPTKASAADVAAYQACNASSCN